MLSNQQKILNLTQKRQMKTNIRFMTPPAVLNKKMTALPKRNSFLKNLNPLSQCKKCLFLKKKFHKTTPITTIILPHRQSKISQQISHYHKTLLETHGKTKNDTAKKFLQPKSKRTNN